MEHNQQNMPAKGQPPSVDPFLINLPADFLRRPIRKRAAQACLACRARKIRCDVVLCGKPCMNCRLDDEECRVVARPTKYTRLSKNVRPEQNFLLAASHHPTDASIQGGDHIEVHAELNDSNESSGRGESELFSLKSGDLIRQSSVFTHGSPNPAPSSEDRLMSPENISCVFPTESPSAPCGQRSDRVDIGTDVNLQRRGATFTSTGSAKRTDSGNSTLPHEIHTACSDDQHRSRVSNRHEPYYSYSFIKPDNLSDVSPSEINYLNLQGSFTIPTRSILEIIVKQYFLCVHPFLPVIDEANFWDMFASSRDKAGAPMQMSLFTFQAMLFAASSFVPVEILNEIGFVNTRDARTTLYRRAKALFDIDGERDTVSTAQGSLLLSYYSPRAHNRTVNTYWLQTAVHYARQAGAHIYPYNPKLTKSQQSTNKRLWWCCILRDRILPLGVHRPLHISHEYFSMNDNLLTVEDFADEIQKSKVYDSTTKRTLIDLVIELCKLCIVLTDVILIVCPVDRSPGLVLGNMNAPDLGERIRRSKDALAQWFGSVIMRHPTPAGIGNNNDLVILFTNLIYIYYHSARVALCHHEVLHWERSHLVTTEYQVQLLSVKEELQDSIASITENTKEVILLKLAKYLPISAVAYTALPLVLHIIDVKLSSTQSQMAIKQRQLDVFMEAMRIYKSHYDGTDPLADSIEKLFAHIEIGDMLRFQNSPTQYHPQESNIASQGEPSPRTPAFSTVVRDWRDVFLQKTRCYLRIAITLELAMSKGEFPDDCDFPAGLQNNTLLSTQFPLFKSIIWDGRSNQSPGKARNQQNRSKQSVHNDLEDDVGKPEESSILQYAGPAEPFPGLNFLSNGQESSVSSQLVLDSDKRINLFDLGMDAQVWSHLQLDNYMWDMTASDLL